MRFISIAVLMGSVFATTPVYAKDDLLDTLAQKGILTVEEYEKLKAQRKTTEVTLNTEDGFKITSADGASSLQVGTLQQLDYAGYRDHKADLANGSELRRSRISVSGTFFKDWQYRFEQEFSGTAGVTDAFVSYNALKPLVITIGQFKQPFGMEALAADKNVSFMERALPFALVPVRAPGLMLATSGANWSVAGGGFGEPVGNAQAGDEGFGFAARGTFAPLISGNQLIHTGLGLIWRKPADNTAVPINTVQFRSKPESNVLAQRFVDTGVIPNVDQFFIEGAELAAAFGAASVQSEYHFVQVERINLPTLNFSGGYVQFAYTLTGEARPYKSDRGIFDGIRPANPFANGSSWGALEIAARLSTLDLSSEGIFGGTERNAALALNWYLNLFLRVSANLVKGLDVKQGAFDGDEPLAYQMRLQLAI